MPATSVTALLQHLRRQWLARNELNALPQSEIDNIARDLGMTAQDLEYLAEKGPDAAKLLYDRMDAIGVSKDDVEKAANGVLRDLERTCACCNEKGVCEKDLRKHPQDPVWQSYCPNAFTLLDLKKLKTS
ncbi:MAG: hypothetical protein WBX25_02735, partial [Rhodomicrobium sp.]